VVSTRARIVLEALCVFNALILTTLGFLAVFFVDGMNGPIVAAAFWLGAGGLAATSRRLRRGTGWNT
jgi:hypothetical protein